MDNSRQQSCQLHFQLSPMDCILCPKTLMTNLQLSWVQQKQDTTNYHLHSWYVLGICRQIPYYKPSRLIMLAFNSPLTPERNIWLFSCYTVNITCWSLTLTHIQLTCFLPFDNRYQTRRLLITKLKLGRWDELYSTQVWNVYSSLWEHRHFKLLCMKSFVIINSTSQCSRPSARWHFKPFWCAQTFDEHRRWQHTIGAVCLMFCDQLLDTAAPFQSSLSHFSQLQTIALVWIWRIAFTLCLWASH